MKNRIKDFSPFSVLIALNAPKMHCAALAKELNNKCYFLIYIYIDAVARGRNAWQAPCLLSDSFYLRKGQTHEI